jgi:hypothetical protein
MVQGYRFTHELVVELVYCCPSMLCGGRDVDCRGIYWPGYTAKDALHKRRSGKHHDFLNSEQHPFHRREQDYYFTFLQYLY